MGDVTVRELRDLDDGQYAAAVALLRTCIPADEMMDDDELRQAYLQSAVPEPSAVLLTADVPVAVMLAEWFVDGRLLLLAYMAVERDRRGAGLGAHLVADVLRRWAAVRPGVLVVAEVDDPRDHPGGEDVGEAVARLRFYERHGARLLPVPYFQPSLRPGSPRVPGMLLLRLDANGTTDPDVPRTFLREYFLGCEGPLSLEDEAVISLVENAGALADPAALWPPSRYTDLPRSPSPID